MRIAVIIHQFPPTYQTGTEILCLRTAQALRQRGHDVRVFAADPRTYAGRPARFEIVESVEVVRVPTRRPRRATLVRRIQDEFHNPRAEPRLLQAVRNFSPDIVHGYQAQQFGLSAMPKLAGFAPLVLTATDFHLACPLVTAAFENGQTCHGPHPGGANCLAHVEARERHRLDQAKGALGFGLQARTYAARTVMALDGPLRRSAVARARQNSSIRALTSASLILAGSTRIREMLVACGAAAESTELFPHAAPTAPVPVQAVGTPLKVAFFGTIAPHKGVHILLDAIAMIPHATPLSFILCGPAGPDRGYVSDIFARARLDRRIQVRPPVPNTEFGRLIGEADVVVMPSLWDENSPLTLLTALEGGRYVVASDVPGLAADVNAPAGGRLFPAGSAAALTEALLALAADPSPVHAVRQRPSRLPGFDRYVDRLEQRYHQLRHGHGVRAAVGAL